jgi:hypothetical protein
MQKREHFIRLMTDALNQQHGTSLTAQQVEMWVGCDTPLNEVSDLYFEVEHQMPTAVSQSDILDICDDV